MEYNLLPFPWTPRAAYVGRIREDHGLDETNVKPGDLFILDVGTSYRRDTDPLAKVLGENDGDEAICLAANLYLNGELWHSAAGSPDAVGELYDTWLLGCMEFKQLGEK